MVLRFGKQVVGRLGTWKRQDNELSLEVLLLMGPGISWEISNKHGVCGFGAQQKSLRHKLSVGITNTQGGVGRVWMVIRSHSLKTIARHINFCDCVLREMSVQFRQVFGFYPFGHRLIRFDFLPSSLPPTILCKYLAM